MAHEKISTLIINTEVSGVYILKNASVKSSANGPYLACQLSDASGTIDAKFWSYTGQISSADDGKAVYIRGRVGEFKGMPQLSLSALKLVESPEEFRKEDLVPVAPIDVRGAGKEILELVDSMSDPDYKNVCREMLNRYGKAFSVYPAAKTVHHSFLSGLLMHTYNMLRLADFLSRIYESVIDRDLLIAGTLLHDFAKTEEFALSPLGTVTDYTVKGELLGHLFLGAKNVADVCRELNVPEDKALLLEHMIASHHGEPEHGAIVRPMTAEAELLNLIDLTDSRMEICKEALEDTEPGSFTDRIFALDNIKLYSHKKS